MNNVFVWKDSVNWESMVKLYFYGDNNTIEDTEIEIWYNDLHNMWVIPYEDRSYYFLSIIGGLQETKSFDLYELMRLIENKIRKHFTIYTGVPYNTLFIYEHSHRNNFEDTTATICTKQYFL